MPLLAAKFGTPLLSIYIPATTRKATNILAHNMITIIMKVPEHSGQIIKKGCSYEETEK
jgi:hypothetical protein